MGTDLFEMCDSHGGDEGISKLEINKDFARRLEHNKNREALQRLEDLKKRGLGHDSDDSDDPDDSSDEEDEDLGSGKNDLQFYDALVRIKSKDPILHEKDAKLFSSDEGEDEELKGEKPRRARKEKPLYLKDVMAKHLIEEGPEFGEKPLKHDSKIYKKEQVEDIKAFLDAEKEALGSDDDDLIKEKKTTGEEIEGDDTTGEIQKKLDEYFGDDGNLSENENFLKKFFLNKMWVDKNKEKKPSLDDVCGVSEDEGELEKQEKYEAEFNFRHEEVEGDRVLGHARFTEGSVRKKTSSRKLQRKSKEERMAQLEFERKEELKHLKNLKKKEIKEKLEKIRTVAGLGEDRVCKLNEDDLEEEFDPEEYDKKMKEMFDVDYYDADDADPGFASDGDDDLVKPDFEKEDELLGLPKDWDVGGSNDGFVAARERVRKQKEEEELRKEEEEPEKEEGKRKRKRKMSLREKLELDKNLEEYYKLDYEDTIGDLKTRFKYKSVPANRYGLHAEEILMADDKDLNQYVSLKKLVPYTEKEWKVTYHQKLKKNLILEGEKSDGKKAHKKHESTGGSSSRELERKIEQEESNGEADRLSRSSRRRRQQAQLKLSHSRLMAYGKIAPKARKKH